MRRAPLDSWTPAVDVASPGAPPGSIAAAWSPCLACDAEGFVVGGRYSVLERLGAGGMGVVHRVWDGVTGRARALKRPALRALRADASSAPFDVRACLAHEHSVLSQLDHPAVVRAHDFGVDDGLGAPYLVLDLIEPARTLVRYAAGVSRVERLGLLVQLFEAIAYLRGAGVVHGDLTPGNVLVSARASPVVTRSLHRPSVHTPSLHTPSLHTPSLHIVDFGVSSPRADIDVGRGSLPIGTALYLAPELLGGRAPSPASDCYAAGLLAIEVLTGVHPLRAAKLSPGLAAILDTPRLWVIDESARLEVSPACVSLLADMVASDPWERFTEVGEIAARFAAERERALG